MLEVVTVETPGLGDRSYLVTDGQVAVVIDPQRDIDRVSRVIDDRRLELTHVLETHIHNDYVTGGLQLADGSDAEYVVAAADEVGFRRTPVADGDQFATGALRLRAVHTPGHTPNHMAYVAAEYTDGGWIDRYVFTGGSLLYGTVGRTDLMAPDLTEQLTRAQYRSARRLLDELAGTVFVMPTHGFGSFCSSTAAAESSDGTVAGERDVNQAAKIADEDAFVRTITTGLTAYPRYYEHMAPVNRAGPPPVDLSPPPQTSTEDVRRRIERGEWVVDVRHRRDFAARHVTGSINVGLDGSFATYLGWVIPWGTPLTLLGSDEEQLTAARRELVRIGIDHPAAGLRDVPQTVAADELDSYAVADFAALSGRQGSGAADGTVVVDVRRDDEWRDGHIKGAVHVPLPDLEERVDEIPEGRLWVHCASGFRASIAASLLARAGREVVLIDDEFAVAPRLGLLET